MKKTPNALFSNWVFYDSQCGFCLACIRFMLKRKKKAFPFCFSSIGGKTFKALQKTHQWESLPNSLILYNMDTDQLIFKGKAVLQLAQRLRFPWNILAYILNIFPDKLLNFFYDTIAKNRYKLCQSLRLHDENTLLRDNPEWEKHFQD